MCCREMLQGNAPFFEQNYYFSPNYTSTLHCGRLRTENCQGAVCLVPPTAGNFRKLIKKFLPMSLSIYFVRW